MKRVLAIIGTSLLIQTISPLTHAAADPPDTWYWRNPLPQGDRLASVVYGNGRFVAVSVAANVIRSQNGVDWTLERPGAGAFARSVSYGNGLFVLVRRLGLIETSPDGATWTLQNSGTTNHLNAAAFGNGLFVVVGDGNTNLDTVILTSPDGITWTPRSGGTNLPLWGVTYANGLFVAVGGNFDGGVILTSPDGITWTPQSSPALTSVAFGNGTFVSVGGAEGGDPAYPTGGGTNVLTSTNGLDWTPRAVPGVRKTVIFANGQFAAVAPLEQSPLFNSTVYTSADGVTWEPHALPESSFIQGITYGEGLLVAVGERGDILTSTNALDWVQRTSRVGTGSDLTGVASSGTQWVALEESGGMLSSSDGLAWTYHPPTGRAFMYGIAYGSGTFVAVGATDFFWDQTKSKMVVETSTDGTTWTYQELADNGIPRAVAFGNSQFVAVGEVILTSPDGATWTRRSPAPSRNLRAITFANGLFVAVGGGGIFNSSNGENWTDVTPLGFFDLAGVAYGNGRFVAVGNRGAASSIDAFTWRTPKFSDAGSNTFSGIDFIGEMFVAASSAGTLVSQDGSQWTIRRSIPYRGSRRIVEANNTLLSVGFGGTILQSAPLIAPPLLGPPRMMGPGEYEFTISGPAQQNVRIDVSGDLSTWQPLTTITLSNPTQTFRDASPGFTQRFYRGVVTSATSP
ncbi:MAG: hypothetical protein DME23_05315 [Verrucomicrobia bacterium]|nr:MAG: hypothetical protein DME23_05315 [Verrucomicrobiota bacterium]